MRQRLIRPLPPGPDGEEHRVNLWRLPRLVTISSRRVRHAEPQEFFVGPERRETRETVELLVQTNEPIPVRAITPLLAVGGTAVPDYRTEGDNLYRFVSFEPERLEPGAPIRWGWPGAPSLASTRFRFSPAGGGVVAAVGSRLAPRVG